MTGRVTWSEYSGEDIERAVAMFVATEHPTAVRITPSRGDGGVDILDRGERTIVYQVKGFHSPLTSGQQAQVKKSVDRLVSDPRWADLKVDEWHLVTPCNPSQERLEWLRKYVKSKGLPDPVWDGRDRCDAWAAKYPYIVDYFFHGSQQTVQEAASRLLEGFRLKELVAGVPDDLRIDDVKEGMSKAVAFLNERDPYYAYGLAVGPPTDLVDSLRQATGHPNLVTAIHQGDKGVVVRIDVFAKTSMSSQERPITVDVRMKAALGSPEEESIQEFLKFGTPLTLPLGAVDADFDGPDALRQSMSDGALSILPASGADDGEPQLRLVVFDREGTQVTSLLMEREYTTQGLRKAGFVQGLEAALVDPSGCLRLLIRFDFEDQSTSMKFDITRPDNVLAVDAFPALWTFLSLRCDGNTFILAPRFGPVKGDRIPAQVTEVPDAVRLWFDVAKSLTLLQEHTAVRLYFPKNLSKVPETWIREVCFIGALLNGQVLEMETEQITTPHTPDRPEPDESGVIVLCTPWKFTIAGTEIDLGLLIQEFSGTFQETVESSEHELLDVWQAEHGVRVRRPTPQEATTDP